MTGRYCWRTAAKDGVLSITSPLHIETDRMTMASLLQSAGYNTAAVGKWHLGYGSEAKTDYTAPLTPGPLQIGFDYHYGVPQNHGDATGVFVENEKVEGLRSARVVPAGTSPYGRPYLGIDAPQRQDDTVMDVLTTRAVGWLRKQSPAKPFFLYFTPVAVHQPVTPSTKAKGTSAAGPYGDWIHDLDASVGRILQALDESKLSGNTLVIFSSDNGGVLQTSGDRPETKAYEAGLRVNGEWRGRKHSIYEGGFRVPFLARWPGKVKAGVTSGATINLVDMLATVAAIVGKPLPPVAVGAEDSHNVLPALLGEKLTRPLRESMIVHSVDGVFAIREGGWKYIEGKASARRVPNERQGEAVAQLFHLDDDPKETKDLLATQPEVAARLRDRLATLRTATHSRPAR
jgi:arylsulfatase A-like enzyme